MWPAGIAGKPVEGAGPDHDDWTRERLPATWGPPGSRCGRSAAAWARGLPAGTGRDSDPPSAGEAAVPFPVCRGRAGIWTGTGCRTVPRCVLFAVTRGGWRPTACSRRYGVSSPWPRRRWARRSCAVWLDDAVRRLLRRPGCGPNWGAGEFLTPPFSPGYGDWSLTAQGRVFGPAPGPRADRADPHGRGNAGARRNPSPPWWASRDRPEDGLRPGMCCAAAKRLSLPVRTGGERTPGALSYETTAPGDEGAPPLSGRRHGNACSRRRDCRKGCFPMCGGWRHPQAVQGVHRAYLGSRLPPDYHQYLWNQRPQAGPLWGDPGPGDDRCRGQRPGGHGPGGGDRRLCLCRYRALGEAAAALWGPGL